MGDLSSKTPAASDQAAPDVSENVPAEIVPATTRNVACDGDGAGSGHPRVYLKIGGGGAVDCPYCGRRFVLAEDGATEH